MDPVEELTEEHGEEGGEQPADPPGDPSPSEGEGLPSHATDGAEAPGEAAPQADSPASGDAEAPSPEAGSARQLTTIQNDTEGPLSFDGSTALTWIGGFSGLALILAIAVAFGVRSRKATPNFEEPQQDVVPVEHREQIAPTEPHETVGGRLRRALSNSRAVLMGGIDKIFGGPQIDEAAFDELEEALLRADVSLKTVQHLLGPVREGALAGEATPSELRAKLHENMKACLAKVEQPLERPEVEGPWVLLVVGVNGSGKTTTIGKLAARLTGQGAKVMLAAGDTFRAAAVEQLKVWADRAAADIVAGSAGADPGAVTHDALQAALARGHDVVIVDTAGRLQTERPLMEQLSKIRRVIDKVVPGAPHSTLLVLDGTMGQNGLSQARTFHDAAPLTGVVITKLDGTAKGGMLLTLAHELEVPIQLLGIGEGIDDLKDFDADAFIEALA
ncbi:MAG: signal recognition particle-docking protein FtsY [Deltaproteobacteria bacterium]|nr:MAG: signal recognition particle-docking protein FtsY [Deltaproteobacteria bacterium]